MPSRHNGCYFWETCWENEENKRQITISYSSISLYFNLSSWENNWKLIPTILFITAYNLALVCCNCTFETQLKKEKLRKGPRSFIFPTATCFISSFLIGSYQPASIRFLLSSLSTKNTCKCSSQWQRPAPHISCLPPGDNPDNPDIPYFYWQILLVVLDRSNSELSTFVNTSSVRKGILSLPFHSCWLNWGK